MDLLHFSFYSILSYVRLTYKLTRRIEDILRIIKENQYEDFKITDILCNQFSLTICITQA